ncbi:MAG: leucine-rich repeat domain-containing protein [Selenomonadaceae bacterium]|nr:leucine-rich repeat domain-containing protein [Selenomonadaceae bacterium]
MTGGKCGENVTWLLSGDTLIINGKGAMENYKTAPKRISPIPWENVSESIKEIIISDGITFIGTFDFVGCTNLVAVKIPDSVTTIGIKAFSQCESLTSVTIPNSVTSIGNFAFSFCTNLRKITIPDSVTSIGIEVFGWCTRLKEIYYPSGRGFEKNLSAGNNAQLIPYNAEVQKAVAEKAEQIREKLLPLWWEARRYNSELRWKVEGKTLTVGGVSEIKAYSYEETPWRDSLNDIQRIIIEEGVEKISARAFEECRRLELLTIPASVKTIGDIAFSFCYCGNGLANGGRNVYWTLEDGVLNLKKNLTVRGDADFSTGAVTWLAIDKNIKNIKGIKLEAGVVPKEKFFEWLGRRSNALQIAFG